MAMLLTAYATFTILKSSLANLNARLSGKLGAESKRD